MGGHATVALEVGTAFLQVVPSLKNLHRKIAAEVARIKDIEIDVTPNMAGFREKVAAGTRGTRAVEVDVDVNTDRARREVGAFATQMRSQLEAAARALPDITVDADTSPAQRRITEIRAALARLSDQQVGVDVSTGDALLRIRALQAELTELATRSPNIDVKVNTAAAIAQLALLRRTVGDVDRDGNRVLRTFGAVARGFGGIIGQVGQIASLMARMGSASAQAAGSLAAVSGAAANTGGSMASLGTSMTTAVTKLGVSVGSLVASLTAVAAVGAVAVAGIGQLGGAVIALASGIVPLVGLLGTLPGVLAPVVAGIGALVIAFGDAGLKAEVDKLKQAFQPLINDVRNQLRPALTELLGAVGELAPVFQRVAPVITSALSDVARGFSDILKSSTFKADFESLMRSAGDNVRGLGTAAQSAFRGLTDMAIAAQPAVDSLVKLIQDGAARFAEFMAEGRRTGELATFFQQGVDVLRRLMDVLGNISGLFKDLWDSANRTGAFQATLGAINDGITRFRDYVDDAGGAWDRLMARAGPVTEALLRLVGSIGEAFVEMGADVDIVPLLDSISDAIRRVTPAFKEIAQAAVPAIQQVIEVVSELVEKFGPGTAAGIESFGAAFEDLGPIFEGVGTIIGDVISSILIAVESVSIAADGIISLATAAKQAITGDFAGAAQTMSDFSSRTGEAVGRIGDLSGLFGAAGAAASGAAPPVAGLGTAIQGIPDRTVVIDINTTSIAPEINTVKAFLNTVPESQLTRFLGDYTNIAAAVGVAVNETATVPDNHPTAFTGDASGVTAAAGTARSGIASVLPDWLTRFTGDTGNLVGAAGVAQSSVRSVLSSWLTAFTGDPSGAVGAANTATGAINGVPPEKSSTIRAQDLASSVIRGIISALNAIPRLITTVVRTVTGGAGGLIMSPMASGGVLPMAQGDAFDRMRPMSGKTARIVPPQTFRLIGDRMVDDEAFIPINDSPWSTAILGETARRKGFALMPMAHGGFSGSWGNPQTWDWIRRLLGSLLNGRPGGGPGSPGGGGSGGVGGLPGLAPPRVQASRTLTSTFQAGSGLASVTRANPRYAPTPWAWTPPDPREPVKLDLQFRPSGNRFIDALLEEVARAVRARGGNSQQFFGHR